MRPDTALTWSWLNVLTRKRYDALVGRYGSLDDATGHIGEELLRKLGAREETVFATLNRLEECDPERYMGELRKRDLTLVTIEDAGYPARLREIPDAPVFLYFRGDLSLLDQPCIALVGTRDMSDYGRRVTESFVPAFVRAGMVTVSGLALGIDACVAEETIRGGGRTVAVLGHGLGAIHPKSNARLAERIVESGGLLLCEYPIDIAPDLYTFPARNRIIAGLTLGTVVLEAGEGSGAIITAELALDYGREVFAVPGQVFDPNFAGSHQLIARGQARLVAGPAEVLTEIGVVAATEQDASPEPEDPLQREVYSLLTSMPQSVDVLMERSGKDASVIGTALTMMELAGATKNVGNGLWVRS